MEAKLVLAEKAIPGIPGLAVGEVALHSSSQIVEGYEYDVYDVLYSPTRAHRIARVRVDHRHELTEVTVDWPQHPRKIVSELKAISASAMKGGASE